MNKFKAFFARVRDYIKNTAWIQPLLIVVVIFVILFSLSPLTAAIKKGWTNLTTVNHMDKISYKEYVEKVKDAKDDEKFIIVFTQKGCDHCPKFYKSMNEYLDSSAYKASDVKIYNVDLSTKSTKVKIDGVKYTQYKDASCGLVSPASSTKNEIIAQDYVKKLDVRIDEFRQSFGEEAYADLTTVADSTYTYVSTPLVVWYDSGLETRISNNFESSITLSPDGKKATATSFKSYIENFGDGKNNTIKADNWSEPFDLTYSEHKNIKDAF